MPLIFFQLISSIFFPDFWFCNVTSFNVSSMPHRRNIIAPIVLSIIAFGISLRTLSQCDFFIANWSFGCNNKGECNFNTRLSFGLLFKETVVRVIHNGLPIREYQCIPYLDADEWILQEPMWKLSRMSSIGSLILAALSITWLCSMFCIAYKKSAIKIISFALFFSGIFNIWSLAPMISRACSEEGLCNPEQKYCMSTCQLNKTAWIHIASSFIYIACFFIVNTIPTYTRGMKRKEYHKSNNKSIIYSEHNQNKKSDETINASQSTDSESTASCDASQNEDEREDKFQNETSNDIESGDNYDTAVESNKQ